MRAISVVGAALAGALVSWVAVGRRERRTTNSWARAELARCISESAHVLRGFLTPIVARAHLLEAGRLGRTEVTAQAKGILRSALRLERAIDQLARNEAPPRHVLHGARGSNGGG